MSRADLHTHSAFSDGTLSPAEVVRRAHARGVELLALTDHDTTSGAAEALEAGKSLGLRIFCGVEINTCEGDLLHILGYRVDLGSPKFQERLADFRSRRQRRMLKILEQLKTAGVEVTAEDLAGVSKESLGRPHVADAMVRKEIVRNRKEAFDRFLSRGKPGYVAPMGPTPEEAIAAIREAGGWAGLAHPGDPGDGVMLKRLVDGGLQGIEAFYPTHSQELIRELLELAARYDLIPTAGSDFHGPRTGRDRIGGFDLSPEAFGRLERML